MVNEAKKRNLLNGNICYDNYEALRHHCSEKSTVPQDNAQQDLLYLSEDISIQAIP